MLLWRNRFRFLCFVFLAIPTPRIPMMKNRETVSASGNNSAEFSAHYCSTWWYARYARYGRREKGKESGRGTFAGRIQSRATWRVFQRGGSRSSLHDRGKLMIG
ncbi:uncharacterized protein BCR38DRAFT_428686 [Pseudomassariella vexata]|uniref:Secreted protein n=1 Tax=Pseudomassariella vexata TaxID=1141098 RepID=A0A1Y2E4X0_9PEZI|nr:uncharacterized protein BCR38DRAFT_428686 [Pseudomassariella vexata]ORY65905.1 hypothetical protein BCR38DRAFT_428686 [Pseudomassariella vexata]